jgi:hypothetical protein
MKKGQNYKEQLLTLSCIRVDSSQIKTKTQQIILAPNLLSSYFFIFSQFFPPTYQSTFLPTHLPKKVARA